MPEDISVRPDDLITAQKAAKASGKSKSTIRSWVRQNKLTGYRKDPSKSNSALMISLSELQLFLIGTSDKQTPKSDTLTGRPSKPSVSIGHLEAQIQDLKSQLTISENKLDSQSALVKQQEDLINELKEMKEWLRMNLEREKEKNDALQSQINRMNTYLALPWWKKWNAGVPLLEG